MFVIGEAGTRKDNKVGCALRRLYQVEELFFVLVGSWLLK